MGFMTSLAGLHGGLTLQQMHEQQSKRQRFVSSLDEQVTEKAARKERERLEFERQEQRDARLYGSHWTANQRDKSQPAVLPSTAAAKRDAPTSFLLPTPEVDELDKLLQDFLGRSAV